MINFFEPNFHPLIVHFVIAFLITGPMLLLLVALLPPDSKLRVSASHAGDWMIGLGLLAMITAIAAGFQAYYSVAHDGPSHIAMTDHRNWAIVTAISYLAIGLFRLRTRKKPPTVPLAMLFLVPVGLLTITGWKGGHLVYGYGLGVASLPEVSGEGHDHDHAPGAGHEEPTPVPPMQHRGDNHTGHDSMVEPREKLAVPEHDQSSATREVHDHSQHEH